MCVITGAIGTRNAESVRAGDRFVIHPFDLRAVEQDLRAANDGSRTVGYFHSHPDAPARPSATDLEMAKGLFEVAREFFVYAIARVSAESVHEMTLWRLAGDSSQFIELKAIAC